MHPFLQHSGSELARMIRAKKASCREVVETHIDQIRKVNPVLNAVVQGRFDLALREAAQADEALTGPCSEALQPFHGVPCSIKECFALTGMPNTSGLAARRGVVSHEDAVTVQRLRKAGAIPLGVTNVSELCMWMETNNKVYGRTRNPYHPGRIVGGSSGGEGAIISAGGAPFGLGSDIGGSIRLPAFFNGVFGHKPSGGLVPNTGQYPISENEALRYLTTGPIARRAEDLLPLLRILAGPDGRDRGCLAMEIGDPSEVRLEELRVLLVRPKGTPPVCEDLLWAREKAAAFLARRGARVREVSMDGLRHSREIWSAMLARASDTTFRERMGNGTPISAFRELLLWMLGRSSHTLPAIILALFEQIPERLPTLEKNFVELGKHLRRQFTELMGSDGILLHPPYVSAAPPHNKPMFPPFNWVYTAIFNVMEFPVTQVPLGLNREGLPIGVQIVGPHGRDHVTIAVALAMESEFGGWVPPQLVG